MKHFQDKTMTFRIDQVTYDILCRKSREMRMNKSGYIRYLIRLAELIKFTPSYVVKKEDCPNDYDPLSSACITCDYEDDCKKESNYEDAEIG